MIERKPDPLSPSSPLPPSSAAPSLAGFLGDGPSLIGAYLEEQRNLTAVERFSSAHDRMLDLGGDGTPRLESHYKDLLPLEKPRPGQQYAFEVDLDRCTGCKACVTACHALNGLEDDESWRSVGLLVGEKAVPPGQKRRKGDPVQRTVTTACHHCADPGCLNGCPVLAYEKDPVTGIVRHLDDQCIGCQYCVMKCPYEVPQYSKRLGVVRKCDMCSQRLAVGEAPACVQACPNEAIRIAVVDVAETTIHFRPSVSRTGNGHNGNQDAGVRIHKSTKQPVNGASDPSLANAFLPSAPRPGITVPTTRYKSTLLESATLRAADEAVVQPADSHGPLALMLPLSQLSVGLLTGATLAGSINVLKLGATAAVVVMAVALGIATMHLGQPLRAWKVFLGWRKSWFSREALAFGGYLKLSGGLAFGLWLKADSLTSGNWHLASGIASFIGLVSIFCSVMLYADTQREFWSFPRTAWKFGGSTVLLGLAATNVVLTATGAALPAWWLVPAAAVLKLLGELEVFTGLSAKGFPALKRSALLVTGPLQRIAWARMLVLLPGGFALPVFLSLGPTTQPLLWSALSLALLLAGEICERLLFFSAVAPDRMPGGVSA